MASVGFGLLRSVILGEIPFSSLREKGIDDSYFQGSEKQAYNFVLDYFNDFGRLPLLETIGIEVDKTNCFDNLPEEPFDFWISKVKERKRHFLSSSGIAEIRDKLESNQIDDAVESFGLYYSQLKDTYTELRTLNIKDAERQVVDHHNFVQSCMTIPGIPFGFPYLDAISGGAQPGDSSVIAGMTAAGKSMVALKIGLNGWYAGKNILCLCTEMPVMQVARRLLAMEGNFDATHLKLGRMSAFGIQRALHIIDNPLHIEGEPSENWFKLLPGGLYSRLDDILLIAKDLNPDMLILDGASLIRSRRKGKYNNRWETMIEVMEGVKNFAMQSSIATLSTYHFGKQQSGTTEGIYGGLAMSQLASMVMAVEYERKEDRISPTPIQYRTLRLIKGRDGETGAIRLLFNMNRSDVSQDRVLEGYSIQEDQDDIEYFFDEESSVLM